MRRAALLLLIAALSGGCEWDGPPRDVRVVTSDPVGTPASAGRSDGTGGADTGGAASAQPTGTTPIANDRTTGGLEDRPGALGRIDVPSTVAVVGDSLTVAATDEITAALSRVGVRAVIVDGRESRRMVSGSSGLSSGVAAIEGILDEHEPDLWVVALGTNDIGAAVGEERFRSDLRATLGTIPAPAPVVWVDVWIRDRLDAVLAANAVLRDELAGRSAPTLVVDWFSSGPVDGVITADGVHLTETGQARFATAIADAVVELAVSAS